MLNSLIIYFIIEIALRQLFMIVVEDVIVNFFGFIVRSVEVIVCSVGFVVNCVGFIVQRLHVIVNFAAVIVHFVGFIVRLEDIVAKIKYCSVDGIAFACVGSKLSKFT
jgi:hypothetical protein